MLQYMIEALAEAERAERAAAELRRAYGPEAERRCKALIASTQARTADVVHYQNTLRALRWTKF